MQQIVMDIKDVENEDLDITEEKDYSLISNTNINQYKVDLAFKTLVEGFDELLYIIPKYQRKFIWSKDQVENLAISLIRGLPIPPIYVYKNKNNQMIILDGQQRVLSLFLYYKSKYIKNSTNTQVELQRLMDDCRLKNNEVKFEELLEKEYPLKNVSYQFKYEKDNADNIIDITYNKLPKDIKRRVDYTTISVIEIQAASNNEKNRVLYKIFENLNSGGTVLTNQELRNGVYQCDFYDMLHNINNTNKKWRNIYGEKHMHSRDVELLLRFSALDYFSELKDGSIELNKYKNSYPKFLNDFSDEAIKFDDKTIELYKNNLERFIYTLDIDNRVPNLLLESLYTASIYVKDIQKIKQDLCDDIIKNECYKNCINNSSSSKSKIKERLNYVYNKLSEYVDRDS